jgi:L-seryl-tRNA(Ser) seleniumtransferase
MQDLLRHLPSVRALSDDPALADHMREYGHDAVVCAARRALDDVRGKIRQGAKSDELGALSQRVIAYLDVVPCLYRAVLNATGVILHTNLGRAPIPPAAWRAMEAAAGYCDLEMDLETGKRASRLRGVEKPLTELTGAQAGMVVNNNAAAILLTLAGLAGCRPTAISRSQLVEIGGGFRLPTIMEASGSPLMEVGTTNRTHLADYIQALDEGASLILCVHWSNFVMEGYVTQPSPEEIVKQAHAKGAMIALDLGSGALLDTQTCSLPKEDRVQEAVQQGFDAICFSGDKLLGGPQAGYIVGKSKALDKLKKHPLARALRCDKIQLAGCVATLELYRRCQATTQIPIWKMSLEDTQQRAMQWLKDLKLPTGVDSEVIESSDAVGGGSLPGGRLKGHALAVGGLNPDDLMAQLRRQQPPIVAHISENRVLLHPRTIEKKQDAQLVGGLQKALQACS